MTWRRLVVMGLAGFLFALGLGLSGMTQPARVIGFLDVAGDWDPTLLFVMGGAVTTYTLAHRFSLRLERPLLADLFRRVETTRLDARLVIGSALFGIGWGLAGYCPGPALTSIVSGGATVLTFVGAMVVGIAIHSMLVARAQGGSHGSSRVL